jgi:hypothetical protein
VFGLAMHPIRLYPSIRILLPRFQETIGSFISRREFCEPISEISSECSICILHAMESQISVLLFERQNSRLKLSFVNVDHPMAQLMTACKSLYSRM